MNLFVYYFHLLAYAFFVYSLEHMFHKFRIHTAQRTLCATLVKDFIVTSCLEDSHIVFFLECSDFTAHAHTFCHNLHQFVVAFVYLASQPIACWHSDAISSRLPPIWLGSHRIGRLGIRLLSSIGICHCGRLR